MKSGERDNRWQNLNIADAETLEVLGILNLMAGVWSALYYVHNGLWHSSAVVTDRKNRFPILLKPTQAFITARFESEKFQTVALLLLMDLKGDCTAIRPELIDGSKISIIILCYSLYRY